MSNTQYAVCHLQRGSGNDSRMSCHIERKDANWKKYVPVNADADRTHFYRELVMFPAGVKNRTDAIQYRIDHAGLHHKVGKNQTKAIRIILTGTHEQMMKIVKDGRLDSWIDANLKWLKDTFGSDNLVSCVLHIDEKTSHLHATIYGLINDVFEPQEQVNEAQANLLGVTFELATGDQAQVHVGTGSGSSSSELPWNDNDLKKNTSIKRR